MTYLVVAHYRADGRAADVVTTALEAMVEPSRAEPGNLAYRVARSTADACEFVLFEEYVDEDAFEAHKSSPHFTEHLAGVVLPNLAFRERFDLSPLGATG